MMGYQVRRRAPIEPGQTHRALESETDGDYASVTGRPRCSGTGERTIWPAMIIISDSDLQQIGEGTHDSIYEKLGAHVLDLNGSSGTHFGVWAPHAREVSVIGDFNGWNPWVNPLERRGRTGVWSGFVPAIGQGALYKFSMVAPDGGSRFDRADPYAFAAEPPPGTASKVWDLSLYEWGDGSWMAGRGDRQSITAPITIYEVHLGSWMRVPEEGNRPLTYREAAPRLAKYAAEMGFTHVELLPVFEHPAAESWGYQAVSLYAPSARFGTPHDLMFLVDTLHQAGIGVILDWVPAHFAPDPHGLAEFDGTHLYEPADPKRRNDPGLGNIRLQLREPPCRQLPDRKRPILAREVSFRRPEGRRGGIDDPARLQARAGNMAAQQVRRQREPRGRRVPARGEPEGPRGPPRGADVRRGRDGAARHHCWPARSGGLGFDYKWDLGWVHDTLEEYMPLKPAERPKGHTKLVFRMHYAFHENYLLPLSHDDSAPGKKSLLAKMPGDESEKRANLRLLYGYMFALPGKKLMFMGDEFGQWKEWAHETSLDWHLLEDPRHDIKA